MCECQSYIVRLKKLQKNNERDKRDIDFRALSNNSDTKVTTRYKCPQLTILRILKF